MSLADKLDALDVEVTRPTPGPVGACRKTYGPGTLEDWERVDALRHQYSWNVAQKLVDKVLEVEQPIKNNIFVYHWKRKCSCWPVELGR